MPSLKETDQKVFEALEKEKDRQQNVLELIPSENVVSKAVLEAVGSVLIQKYSEGYPSKRYYGGNQYIDIIENLAIQRAKEIFRAEHANVQPYSGSQANLAVYLGLLEFKDKILGMKLSQGGHLTHGHKVSLSGKAYNFLEYGVDEKTHLLDYDKIRKIAKEGKPKMIVSGATAYPRIIDFKQFSEIAEEIDAISMADISHIAGLIVGEVHPTPFPFTDVVTTTTHKTLRGPRGAVILCKEKYAKDIDKAVFPGMQGGPHDNTNAAKAITFKEASTPEFKEYAQQIVKNAKVLAESLMEQGLDLISGGTDNHLILIDLTKKGVTGIKAETNLDEAHITVNKNTIPYDLRSPFDPSGIRIGTPFITSRGMKEREMKYIGELIARVIDNINDKSVKNEVKEEIIELNKKFPLNNNL